MISILLSVALVETDERIGPEPVAAFVIFNSLTGVPTSPKTRFSSPPPSAINPPSTIFGAVKVLLVKVVVELAVTAPKSALASIQFVPSV